MGIFSRKNDPGASAQQVRTTGIVERVHVTRLERGAGTHTNTHHAHLTIRFTDGSGAETVVQREFWLGYPPAPGSSLDLVYLPDNIEHTLDFDHNHPRPPDQSVPRGWGAGIFEIDPIGPYPALKRNPDLDAERQLFQQGAQVEAEVVHRKFAMINERHGTIKATLTLAANGTQLKKEFWADPQLVPEEGEHIQVVSSPDGSQVALDTDERYYGPPGRALVWTTPAGLAAIRADPTGVAAQLASIDKRVATGHLTEAMASVMRDQIQPPENPTTPIIPGNPVLTRQLSILDMKHKAGKLSDEKYEQMRADIVRYNS